MNNSSHTHWLSLSWWIGYISFGSLFVLSTAYLLIFHTQNIFFDARIFDYLGVLFLITIGFPISLILFTRPFLTRVVIKPQGIEYRSTFFILQADWEDLVNIGYVENTIAGKTLVVISRKGQLIFRKWAKPFQIIYRKEYPKKIDDVKILVSQFRNHNGHSFESDILANVVEKKTLAQSKEPL